MVDRETPYVQALASAISRVAGRRDDQISIGRHGASDANAFLDVGVPAVECGPSGGGHHGPEEWVSIRSLGQYRKSLVEFVNLLPTRLEEPGEGGRHLRIA
jgi:succinyl-diaminopimelate desuccinylase